MSITALSNTTLSALLSKNGRRVFVASTTGITAGMKLILGVEIALVQVVQSTTELEVQRGIDGTRAWPHKSGTRAYFGAASLFGARDAAAVEQPIVLNGPESSFFPSFVAPLGTKRRDGDGNEYVMCDFTGQVFGGTPVQINSDFTAAKVGTTGRGAFGVATEPATSDQWGWVQIYGKCMIQLLGATAGVSPSDAANGPTTLSTTAQTKFWLPTTATSTGPEGIRWTSGNTSTTSGFYIEGLTVAQDADLTAVTAVTAATSHTGEQVSVFLNYPRIVHVNVGE